MAAPFARFLASPRLRLLLAPAAAGIGALLLPHRSSSSPPSAPLPALQLTETRGDALSASCCCGGDDRRLRPGHFVHGTSVQPALAHSAPGAAVAAERAAYVRDLLEKLRRIVPAEQLLTTDVELESFGVDAHSHHSGSPPDVVVFPSSTAEVSAVLSLCNAAGIPIVPRGAATSLEGNAMSPHRGVCLDMSRMDAVLRVSREDLDCTVQPGVLWQELNAALAPLGLFFPMDPGPGASLGGMAGTNCSGTNAVRHGTMKANVLSLEVVRADGRVLRTGARARKCAAGYDLTSLFVGSEGTLGVVTELTLKLQPLPPATAVAVCAFPGGVADAVEAVAATVRSGVVVGAVELLDAAMVRAVNAQSGFAYAEVPHVFFKFVGAPAKIADDAAAVEACASAHGGASFEWAADAAARERLWEARKVALWSVVAMDPARRVLTTDVCVPLSRLPPLMAAMEARAAASALRVYAVGHVGDGNAHHFIAFDPDAPAEVAEAHALNEFLVRAAQAHEGTCTGEHGVGMGKIGFLEAEYGAEGLAAMHAIKRAFDPRGILNPGKKLPPEEAPPA